MSDVEKALCYMRLPLRLQRLSYLYPASTDLMTYMSLKWLCQGLKGGKIQLIATAYRIQQLPSQAAICSPLMQFVRHIVYNQVYNNTWFIVIVCEYIK